MFLTCAGSKQKVVGPSRSIIVLPWTLLLHQQTRLFQQKCKQSIGTGCRSLTAVALPCKFRGFLATKKFCRCRKFEWLMASKCPAYVKGFTYRINGINFDIQGNKDAMQQSVKIFRKKNFDMVIWAGDPPAEHSCAAVFLSIATVLPDVVFVAGKRANDSQNMMLLCHSDWVALGGTWCGGENSVRELAILDTHGVATSTLAAWREQKNVPFMVQPVLLDGTIHKIADS